MGGGITRIQLCGRFLVRLDGERVDDRLPGRQGELLLAYLVVHRGRALGRERLIDAIWPLGAPAAADSALSALLSRLRRAVDPSWIEGRSKITLRLPEGSLVDLDAAREAIHRAESMIAQDRWPDAWGPARVALHTANRGFLLDWEGAWIDELRREVEGIQQRALECVAVAGLGLGGPEIAASERAGSRLIELNPYAESGYCHLIEALAARDQIADALRVYDRLRKLLRDELGIAPGERAQVLHRRLLESRASI